MDSYPMGIPYHEKGVGRGWWGPPRGTHGAGSLGGNGPLATMSAPLTNQEVAALHDYTWLSSQTLNHQLRQGKIRTTRSLTGRSDKEQIDRIDSAIAKATLSSDAVLYSKQDLVRLLKPNEMYEKGDIVLSRAYLSVSSRKEGVASYPGQRFDRPAVLELRVSRGAKGVLPLAGVSHYPQEKEYLIHRDVSYRIIDVKHPSADEFSWTPVRIMAELLP